MLDSSIAPGATSTFTVNFHPAGAGLHTATLQIASSDADENPFVISLVGTGVTPMAAAQEAYLKASNPGSPDFFGQSVAVSGDTVVVGAYIEDSGSGGVNGNQSDNSADASGAVYVFVRSGSTWSQQAYIKASNPGADDFFGRSVAISGHTLIVGAHKEDSSSGGINGDETDNGTSNSGAAYVFVRNGTTWTQEAYLKAPVPGLQDDFGFSVSISGDTAVIGELNADAAHVYIRSETTWSHQAELKASNFDYGDYFGVAVAIDGDTAVVGASREKSGNSGVDADGTDNSEPQAGAAYVFVRSGTSWSQEAYLKASNVDNADLFGNAVAISVDTVVVGAPGEGSDSNAVNGNDDDNSAYGAGAAYVFKRNGASWSQEAYLKAPNSDAVDEFGFRVGVSGDAVVVGARFEDSGATGVNGDLNDNSAGSSGAAYIFVRDGANWNYKQSYLKASNTEASDRFGEAVGISGNLVVVGALGEKGGSSGVNGNQADNSLTHAGAAYVFEFSSEASTPAEMVDAAIAAAGLTGPDAEWLAEPFNDGTSNLLKYAFNMNLGGPDSHQMSLGGTSGLPGGGLREEGGQTYWRVEFVRRKNSGLLYTPKKSTTLQTDSFAPFSSSPSVSDIDGTWERAVYDEPCDPSVTPKCFSHVEVTVP